MNSLTQGIVIAAGLLLIALGSTACGGAQRGGQAPDTPPWASDIFEAVPAESGAVLVSRLGASEEAIAERGLAQLMIHDAFERWLGIQRDESQGLEQYGFEPSGDLAIYVQGTALTIVVSLRDEARFEDVIKEMKASQPDADWSVRRIAGVPVHHAQPVETVRMDLLQHGGFAAVRLSLTADDVERGDADIAQLLTGHQNSERLYQTPEYRALSGTMANADVHTVGYLRTAFLSEAALAFARRTSTRPDRDPYETPAMREDCQAASASMIATLPWLGFAAGDEAEQLRIVFRALMSESAARRFATFMPGAPTFRPESLEPNAMVASGQADLRAIVDALPSNVDLAGCPDLAALQGFAALAAVQQQRALAFNSELFTGMAALALTDVRLEGFAPLVVGALMLGTHDPTRLITAIQNAIAPLGARGRVLEGTVATTIEYRLLHLRLRIMRMDDRVVLSLGDAPVRTVNDFLNSDASSSAKAMEASWNGALMRPILGQVQEYLLLTGLVPEEMESGVDAAFSRLEAIESATMEARVEPNGLVVEILSSRQGRVSQASSEDRAP